MTGSTAVHRLRIALTVAALASGGCATGGLPQTPDNGKLTVGVTTTGLAASPATFRLTIEPAGISGTVRADAGVFVNDHLPAGDHVIRLEVPSHCRVDNGAERKITMSRQRPSAVVRFEVRCS